MIDSQQHPLGVRKGIYMWLGWGKKVTSVKCYIFYATKSIDLDISLVWLYL